HEQIEALFVSAADENERLETVLDSLAEGILVCDENHAVVLVNKYGERLLHTGHYETGIQPVWTLIRDDKMANFFKETLINGDRAQDREFDLDINGIQRLVSASILPLVKDKHVTGSLIHLDDITEKRSREAQLRRAENLASLTTLAAGVAHEIKNPLGSISIHIQLIQKTMNNGMSFFKQDLNREEVLPDDNKQVDEYFDSLQQYLGVVNEEIDRLNKIVVDFLFAVRPMNMDFRKQNANHIVQELTDFVQFELNESHITLDLQLCDDLPWIDLDERFLKQALLNLIKNAIAAMPDGGILSIKTSVIDNAICIVVCDTGIGIPEENLSKIFEPYFTTKDSGSGLGLTLVFKIIREHQGEISVKSKPNDGTCFSITLPIPQKDTRLIPYGGSNT
ncbi:MAG: PAS domain S-box protein, partial [Treponema sp.]|nr:PAS domain S-box protein [Treponema sp.]